MSDYIGIIATIKNTPVYKQILADSFGGVMYNVANRGKYKAKVIELLWEELSNAERASAGGIMQGVFNFLNERGSDE